MRNIDLELQIHLESGATTLCTCWRIERRDGAVLGFSDHDRTLIFDGVHFEPHSGVDGTALQSSADLAADNSELSGALTSEALSPEDLAAGRYDGAEISVWRVNWANVAERLLVKKGSIGDVIREGERFRAEMRGLSHHLSRRVGRVYQRHCDAILGDARCSVDLSTAQYTGTGEVSALLDSGRFLATGLENYEANWFAHGLLQWESGENTGTSAHVKAHAIGPGGASLSLWLPTGASIAIGDQFSISAGCDKRNSTCLAKFSNLINFRGFHLMPGNDFVVSYPLRTDDNDGGQR